MSLTLDVLQLKGYAIEEVIVVHTRGRSCDRRWSCCEVPEILDLQAVRDAARGKRYP